MQLVGLAQELDSRHARQFLAGQHQRDLPGRVSERLKRADRIRRGENLVVGTEPPRQGCFEFRDGAQVVLGHRQHRLMSILSVTDCR